MRGTSLSPPSSNKTNKRKYEDDKPKGNTQL